MSDEQQFTRYRVIIIVTSAVRTPAGSVPAPLKGARARPGGSDASPMLKAGPAGYSESPAFRRTKRDRVGPRGSRERARGVYQTYQATGGPSILVVGLRRRAPIASGRLRGARGRAPVMHAHWCPGAEP